MTKIPAFTHKDLEDAVLQLQATVEKQGEYINLINAFIDDYYKREISLSKKREKLVEEMGKLKL